ncbi:MAG TPA: Nif3-like dinuclear metal center hexameric protein [Chitinophaga sp.]
MHFPTNRRNFLSHGLKLFAGAAFTTLPLARAMAARRSYTVQQVIDLILREGHLQPIPNTVDTLKSGSPDSIVTGIVTTMFPTVSVIEAAVKRNANFIIAHEPAFYNHLDKKDWVPNNSVELQKEALLEKHNIAVWRCHDYIHAMQPDGIFYGVMKKAGWLSYADPVAAKGHTFTILALPLGQLADHLKQTLGIDHLRVIGRPQQSCAKIALIPGAAGGVTQVSLVEKEKPDVLIVGELSEWETAEYIRDGLLLGGKTALIVLGHIASEQPGMEYFAGWLQARVQGLPVAFVATQPVFTWI